jgi:cob(I)alamin adenosyltransferase
MKVYTRTGDGGETSLFSGGRVTKDHRRIEAYGTLDELNAVLGLLLVEPLPDDAEARLRAVQDALFTLGSVLADPAGKLRPADESWDPSVLEGWIDAMDAEMEPLGAFILPGGSRPAALAHLARTVCRRAERRAIALDDSLPDGVLAYLNRLSDLLFVLARFINFRLGITDPRWDGLPSSAPG